MLRLARPKQATAEIFGSTSKTRVEKKCRMAMIPIFIFFRWKELCEVFVVDFYFKHGTDIAPTKLCVFFSPYGRKAGSSAKYEIEVFPCYHHVIGFARFFLDDVDDDLTLQSI